MAAPISIRDQVIRAYVLARRLPLAWLRQPLNAPVVVVGAGAAGVTFALAAADRLSRIGIGDANILLVDSEASPFGRQAAVGSRWIDPTQYDWPDQRWQLASVGGRPLPLDLRANSAAQLAIRWQAQLHAQLQGKNPPPIRLLYDTTAEPVGMPSRRKVRITPKGRPGYVVEARLLVDARGFGRETTCLTCGNGRGADGGVPAHFRSERFWEKDDYESLSRRPPRKRHPRVNPLPIVMISGGGDGALQDLIRVATGKRSARAVLRRLPAAAQDMLATRCRAACDQEFRTWAWGDDTGACAAASAMEKVMTDAIEEAYKDEAVGQAMDVLLLHSGRNLDIRIVHTLAHFNPRYPLNRLVALLLLLYPAARGPAPTRKSLTRVTAVQAEQGYNCRHDAVACRSHSHIVELEGATGESPTQCPPYGNWRGVREKVAVDRLIIRHGLHMPRKWVPWDPVRQMPPFSVQI